MAAKFVRAQSMHEAFSDAVYALVDATGLGVPALAVLLGGELARRYDRRGGESESWLYHRMQGRTPIEAELVDIVVAKLREVGAPRGSWLALCGNRCEAWGGHFVPHAGASSEGDARDAALACFGELQSMAETVLAVMDPGSELGSRVSEMERAMVRRDWKALQAALANLAGRAMEAGT